MFEDFRKQSDEGTFEEQLDAELEADLVVDQRRPNFLGMTAPQRFVIALMLLMMTCILGTFCLLATEKIVPPLG